MTLFQLELIVAALLILLLMLLTAKLFGKKRDKKSKPPAKKSDARSGVLDSESGKPDHDGLSQQSAESEEELERRSKDRKEREEEERKRKELLRYKKVQVINAKGGMIKSLLDKIPDMPGEKLEALYLATTQEDIRFDLKVGQKSEVVNYPTTDMEIVPLDDPSQLPGVLPMDLILEDEAFYGKLVNGELLHPEYRETSTEFKRLYILWDVSASMWDSMRMPDGETGTRDIWARAVIAGLLVDAVKGRAEYFLRPFAEHPQELRSVFTSAEAEKLLLWILNESEKGSFTHIGIAVETAVEDIRKRQNAETRMNHILCITDGADNGGLTKEQLEKALGEDIKLHVVLIGATYGPDHPLTPYVMANYQ